MARTRPFPRSRKVKGPSQIERKIPRRIYSADDGSLPCRLNCPLSFASEADHDQHLITPKCEEVCQKLRRTARRTGSIAVFEMLQTWCLSLADNPPEVATWKVLPETAWTQTGFVHLDSQTTFLSKKSVAVVLNYICTILAGRRNATRSLTIPVDIGRRLLNWSHGTNVLEAGTREEQKSLLKSLTDQLHIRKTQPELDAILDGMEIDKSTVRHQPFCSWLAEQFIGAEYVFLPLIFDYPEFCLIIVWVPRRQIICFDPIGRIASQPDRRLELVFDYVKQLVLFLSSMNLNVSSTKSSSSTRLASWWLEVERPGSLDQITYEDNHFDDLLKPYNANAPLFFRQLLVFEFFFKCAVQPSFAFCTDEDSAAVTLPAVPLFFIYSASSLWDALHVPDGQSINWTLARGKAFLQELLLGWSQRKCPIRGRLATLFCQKDRSHADSVVLPDSESDPMIQNLTAQERGGVMELNEMQPESGLLYQEPTCSTKDINTWPQTMALLDGLINHLPSSPVLISCNGNTYVLATGEKTVPWPQSESVSSISAEACSTANIPVVERTITCQGFLDCGGTFASQEEFDAHLLPSAGPMRCLNLQKTTALVSRSLFTMLKTWWQGVSKSPNDPAKPVVDRKASIPRRKEQDPFSIDPATLAHILHVIGTVMNNRKSLKSLMLTRQTIGRLINVMGGKQRSAKIPAAGTMVEQQRWLTSMVKDLRCGHLTESETADLISKMGAGWGEPDHQPACRWLADQFLSSEYVFVPVPCTSRLDMALVILDISHHLVLCFDLKGATMKVPKNGRLKQIFTYVENLVLFLADMQGYWSGRSDSRDLPVSALGVWWRHAKEIGYYRLNAIAFHHPSQLVIFQDPELDTVLQAYRMDTPNFFWQLLVLRIFHQFAVQPDISFRLIQDSTGLSVPVFFAEAADELRYILRSGIDQNSKEGKVNWKSEKLKTGFLLDILLPWVVTNDTNTVLKDLLVGHVITELPNGSQKKIQKAKPVPKKLLEVEEFSVVAGKKVDGSMTNTDSSDRSDTSAPKRDISVETTPQQSKRMRILDSPFAHTDGVEQLHSDCVVAEQFIE